MEPHVVAGAKRDALGFNPKAGGLDVNCVFANGNLVEKEFSRVRTGGGLGKFRGYGMQRDGSAAHGAVLGIVNQSANLTQNRAVGGGYEQCQCEDQVRCGCAFPAM